MYYHPVQHDAKSESAAEQTGKHNRIADKRKSNKILEAQSITREQGNILNMAVHVTPCILIPD